MRSEMTRGCPELSERVPPTGEITLGLPTFSAGGATPVELTGAGRSHGVSRRRGGTESSFCLSGETLVLVLPYDDFEAQVRHYFRTSDIPSGSSAWGPH